jgi:hypothetical protein
VAISKNESDGYHCPKPKSRKENGKIRISVALTGSKHAKMKNDNLVRQIPFFCYGLLLVPVVYDAAVASSSEYVPGTVV